MLKQAESAFSFIFRHKAELGAVFASLAFVYGIRKSEYFKRTIYRYSKKSNWEKDKRRLIKAGISSLYYPSENGFSEFDFRLDKAKFAIRGYLTFRDRSTVVEITEWLEKFFRIYRGDLEIVFDGGMNTSDVSAEVHNLVLLIARSHCRSILVRWKSYSSDPESFDNSNGIKETFDSSKISEKFVFVFQKKNYHGQ